MNGDGQIGGEEGFSLFPKGLPSGLGARAYFLKSNNVLLLRL